MTSPLPTLQYLVAFNNGPLDDPAAITTVASPGTVGAANVWTDITKYVAGHQIARGRQHELSQFEAGTCTLDLWNDDGRFNPWNASGPYYGLLKPKKLLQVRATWAGTTYTRFTGHVNQWPVLWPDPVSQQAQVQATDAFRLLQAADITSAGYASTVLADSPSGYWRFNDVVGSTQIADLGPNNLYGTITPLPGATADPVTLGQTGAMVADLATSATIGDTSTNVGNVSFPGSGIASWTHASIEAWVEYNTSSSPYMFVVFSDGTPSNGLFVTVESPSVVYGGADSGTANQYSAGAGLAAGWHHFVVTKSGTTFTLYIDGVAQTGSFRSSSFGPGLSVQGSGQGGTPMNIQDVAVYPSTLTAGQVAAHYAKAAFPQQSTDARIGHVLDTVGWSAGARSLDAGVSQVQAVTSSLVQTSSLSHMQDCETTEAGALFATNDGKVRFLSRNTLWTGTPYQTSQATFGDNSGEIHFEPSLALALDDLNIYNEATGQRSGGNRIIVDNSTSIGEYGRTTWQPNGSLLNTSDAEVLGRLQYVVNQYAEPVTRLSSIDINMIDAIGEDLEYSTNQVGTILALDLLYRVTVNRHGVPGGGAAFQQTALVERIAETVTPDSWVVTLALDPADTSQQFVWGVSTWGQTTKWAF